MGTTLLILFLSIDTLPPLPDLSTVIFPEPPLYITSRTNSILLNASGGMYTDATCFFDVEKFRLGIAYSDIVDWDTTIYGDLTTSYTIPLSSICIQPLLSAMFLERNDRYGMFSPELRLSSTLPWAIFTGTGVVDLWRINNAHHIEQDTKLEITFDKAPYIPQFEMRSTYTNQQLFTEVSGKLHIRNLHLYVGSPVIGRFPSPRFSLQYLDPLLKISTTVKAGTEYKTLKTYFDKRTPLAYSVSMPEESLRVEVDALIQLDFYKHRVWVRGSYNNWYSKRSIGDDFAIISIDDVQEGHATLAIENGFDWGTLRLDNSFLLHYTWADTALPLTPDFSLRDTVSVSIGFVELNTSMEYLSAREGISKQLPAVFLLNQSAGLRFYVFKLYASVHNALDYHDELYDGYNLNKRQYAGGFEISYKF